MSDHDKQCAEFGNAGWIPGVGDCQCELIYRVRDDYEDWITPERQIEMDAIIREPLIEMIEDLVQQACYMPPEGMDEEYLDSMAISTYARAIRLLAEEGRVKIITEYRRRVIAERIIKEESDG